MNNEEKALEIAKQHKLNYTVRYNGITYTDSSEAECCNSAMDMARLKDDQVKEYLQDKIKEFDGNTIFQITQYNLIEEIYMDLFDEKIPNSNPYTK